MPALAECAAANPGISKARLLADLIAGDIAAGHLRPGDRLPPQREVAWRLGIAVGTVTRAYSEAGRRGLVGGRVGSGTYVLGAPPPETAFVLPGEGSASMIDLSVDIFATPLWDEALREALAALSRADLGGLLEYRTAGGLARHRAAGARWVARPGFAPAADDIAVTLGGQHGIAVAVSALSRPGEVLLVEDLHYPPVRAVAEMLGLTLHGVALDDEGIVPEALEAACRGNGARLLYMTPTLQNPTNAVMGEARRAAIGDILRRYGMDAIEDDVTGCLLAEPPRPVASYAPERVTFLASLSKAAAPGLRTGFLVPPPDRRERMLSRIRAISWFATVPTAEIASRWIEDGTAERMRASLHREHQARHALAAEILVGVEEPPFAGGSPHLWYRLPAPWRSSEFFQAAHAAGVRIACTSAFSARQAPGEHVRISLSAARTRAELRHALEVLAALARQPPPSAVDSAIL